MVLKWGEFCYNATPMECEECQRGVVEQIVNGGWGLVRSEAGVVFLHFVLPGEEVAYRIKERAKGLLWGELVEVLTPSAQRVDPPCPYYGTCGGCAFQHIDYAFQLQIKKEILRSDLQRIGKFPMAEIKVKASPAFHYRMRTRWKGCTDGRLGLVEKGTVRVFPIDRCLLLPEPVNDFLTQWNRAAHPPLFVQQDMLWNPTDEKIYIYLTPPPAGQGRQRLKEFPQVSFSWQGNEKAGVSALGIKDWTFQVSPAAFFQVNRFQWDNMLNLVEQYFEEAQTAIDLYSGVGFFIPLLKKFYRQVMGVESHGLSVQLAKKAFPAAAFFRLTAEKFHFPGADIMLCDPPRSGLSKSVIQQILKKKYRRLIYISCSSASYARDLKILREGGYRLADINLLDLFPHTPHLEIVSLFVLDRLIVKRENNTHVC